MSGSFPLVGDAAPQVTRILFKIRNERRIQNKKKMCTESFSNKVLIGMLYGSSFNVKYRNENANPVKTSIARHVTTHLKKNVLVLRLQIECE